MRLEDGLDHHIENLLIGEPSFYEENFRSIFNHIIGYDGLFPIQDLRNQIAGLDVNNETFVLNQVMGNFKD
jgi:hypothetical protein